MHNAKLSLLTVLVALHAAMPQLLHAQQQKDTVARSATTRDVPLREVAITDSLPGIRFAGILNVVPIAGGRVLVNDGAARRVVIVAFDGSAPRVVFDSAGGGPSSYGPLATPLIRYLGDSTLFVDGASLSLVVIDPQGKPTRVMSAPKPSDLRFLAGGASAVDAQGNLVYAGARRMATTMSTTATNDPQYRRTLADSVPLLRGNFITRTVDTIAQLHMQSANQSLNFRLPDGRMQTRLTVHPLPIVDDWALLSDGTVLIVRGQDYHADIVEADGRLRSAAKLPYTWYRLSDAEKQAVLDYSRTSVAGTQARLAATATAQVAPPLVDLVDVKELPDYMPPIRAGAARADLDGYLWVLTRTSSGPQGVVYDVVDRTGALRFRARLPAGRTIAGFGKGGDVYVMQQVGTDGWRLERARLR
jgi:hypothetical protein